ncbi:MAG: hypothetical protein RML84_08470, partial [Anaerolineae bacterium]|nr:hypothetical protein [Anaerolineae bacterium]
MTEPNATPIPRIAMDFTRLRRPAYVLGAVMFVAVVAFACYSVFDLFNRHLNASLVESALAVLASVGVTVTVLAIVLTNDHKPTRAAGGITLIAWVLLTLALVG